MDSNTPAPQPVQPTQPAPASQPAPAPEPKPEVPVQEKPQASPGDPAEKKGNMSWLYVAVIAMAVVALVLVGFIAYTEIFKESSSDSSSDEGSEEEGMEEESQEGVDVEEEEEEPFAGTYVSVELPDGWRIVEYEDGDGTEMTVTGVAYVGLTALEVINPDDEVVFKIRAVDGIGGVDACDTYAQFPDYNETHYNDAVSLSAETGVTTSPETYEAGDYSEFYFLGLLARRVDDYIFIDEVSGNNYFEPPCGLLAGAWQIPDVSYTADGVESHGYMWEIDDETPEEELLVLDTILSSVTAL